MTELDKKAVELLSNQDSKFYIDMIDPLETGNAFAVSVKEEGTLIKNSDIWMFNALTEERAVEIAEEIVKLRDPNDGVCQHGNLAIEKVMEIVGCKNFGTPCVVAARFSKQMFEIKTDLEFRKLDMNWIDFVMNTYHFFKIWPNSRPLAAEAIERGIYGGFLGEKCVGFIGTHNEGTMGMLEILPDFRRRGYGRALEEFLANKFIEQGRYPFCHVLEDNQASLELQKDMGYWISENQRVYWLY